jgi:hypothetical protein
MWQFRAPIQRLLIVTTLVASRQFAVLIPQSYDVRCGCAAPTQERCRLTLYRFKLCPTPSMVSSSPRKELVQASARDCDPEPLKHAIEDHPGLREPKLVPRERSLRRC